MKLISKKRKPVKTQRLHGVVKFFRCANGHTKPDLGEHEMENSRHPWRPCKIYGCGQPLRLVSWTFKNGKLVLPTKRSKKIKIEEPEVELPQPVVKQKSPKAIVGKLIRKVNRIVAKETPITTVKARPKLFGQVGKLNMKDGLRLTIMRQQDDIISGYESRHVIMTVDGNNVHALFIGCFGFSTWFKDAARASKIGFSFSYRQANRLSDEALREQKVRLKKIRPRKPVVVEKVKIVKEKRKIICSEDLVKPELYSWMHK